MITLNDNLPGARYNQALDIEAGACNPSGIARTLVRAIAEFQASPEYAGTDSLRADPALRLMVHQLAFLMNTTELDMSGDAYVAAITACVAGKTGVKPLHVMPARTPGKAWINDVAYRAERRPDGSIVIDAGDGWYDVNEAVAATFQPNA